MAVAYGNGPQVGIGIGNDPSNDPTPTGIASGANPATPATLPTIADIPVPFTAEDRTSQTPDIAIAEVAISKRDQQQRVRRAFMALKPRTSGINL